MHLYLLLVHHLYYYTPFLSKKKEDKINLIFRAAMTHLILQSPLQNAKKIFPIALSSHHIDKISTHQKKILQYEKTGFIIETS